MALTYTPEKQSDFECPDFTLPSVDGVTYSLKDFSSAKALWIMFICAHCPYVKAVEDRVIHLAKKYAAKGVASVAICSNDPTDYPEDSGPQLLQRWREKDYGFPYLIDESQAVAQAFQAVCTPDFYIFDHKRHLVYRGRLDDSWRHPEKVRRQELKEALDAILAGNSSISSQNPSMGCSIKWKTGD